MFVVRWQIMWVYSQLTQAWSFVYSQIIRAENADVCRLWAFMFASRYSYAWFVFLGYTLLVRVR